MDLLAWKSSAERKPLLVRGARQVGKTYILRDFGQRDYDRIAYFDLERDPDVRAFFDGRLDPEKIVRNLSLYLGWTIEPERHLIVLDEIQMSNDALLSLKYFHDQAPHYHIAAAGSLLGVQLSQPRSFPVGKVSFIDMYPLTFAEFLAAVGRTDLRAMIAEADSFSPFPEPIHKLMIDLLRDYYFVGGMPEAVHRFVTGADAAQVRQVQVEIIDAFRLDFSKHVQPAEIPKLSLIWDSIPAQLARENRKFTFSAIRKSARARDYENALQWLAAAGLILRSYRVTKPHYPLKGYMNREAFKVFVLDIGLLGAMARIPIDVVARGNTLFDQYQGAFVENYVAQQLRARGADLYYWKSEGQRAALDFLGEFEDEILPLEAKAGINPRSKSLRSYDNQFAPSVLSRTTLLNLKRDGRICNYPLYALALFPQLTAR